MKNKLKNGKDYIGVGVGAVIFNNEGEVLIIRRGKNSQNEIGYWGIPGGAVEFGEKLSDAIKREVSEELGIKIKPLKILSPVDHILSAEKQHWVTASFVSKLTQGEPKAIEDGKIDRIEWMTIDKAVQLKKISPAAKNALVEFKEKYNELSDFF